MTFMMRVVFSLFSQFQLKALGCYQIARVIVILIIKLSFVIIYFIPREQLILKFSFVDHLLFCISQIILSYRGQEFLCCTYYGFISMVVFSNHFLSIPLYGFSTKVLLLLLV